MKTRCGFVSNSSSSSFVVKVAEMIMKKDERYPDCNAVIPSGKFKKLLTKDQEEILKQHGFKNKRMSFYHKEYIKEISCNQDYLAALLVHYKIPFVANVHYGNQHFFYDPKNDYVMILYNHGHELAMYGDYYHRKTDEERINDVAGEKIPIKWFEEDYEHAMKEGYYNEGELW